MILVISIVLTNALANPNKYDRDKVIDPFRKTSSARIGDYVSKDSYYNANLYSSHAIDDQIFFGITNDYLAPDSVYVLDGGIERLFEVGAAPGDYATWEIN